MVVNFDQLPYRTTASQIVSHKGIFIEARVLGQAITFLLDTGSAISVLNDNLLRTHFERVGNITVISPQTTVLDYSRKQIPVRGCFPAKTCFKGRPTDILFYVVTGATTLLGIDAIQKLDLLITGVEMKCMYTTTEAQCPSNQATFDEQSPSHSTVDGERKTSDGQREATTEASQLKAEWQTSGLSKPMSERFNHLFMEGLGCVEYVVH